MNLWLAARCSPKFASSLSLTWEISCKPNLSHLLRKIVNGKMAPCKRAFPPLCIVAFRKIISVKINKNILGPHFFEPKLIRLLGIFRVFANSFIDEVLRETIGKKSDITLVVRPPPHKRVKVPGNIWRKKLGWNQNPFQSVLSRDVRGGAIASGAGRGWKSAGRRWKSAGRSGAGGGEKAHRSTDPKIRQKCVNCYWRICITVWCFEQGKHYILWLLDGLSANQIITSCIKDQMKSFSFISPL